MSSKALRVQCGEDGVGRRKLLIAYKATALKAEMWAETVTEGGRTFMTAWRKEEDNAVRHRQKNRVARRLGKLLSHTEA